MPKYTFTFKKDDMFVEFISTDKYIVERQFPIWVNDASIYAKKRVDEKVRSVEAQKVRSVEEKPMPEQVAEEKGAGNREQETENETAEPLSHLEEVGQAMPDNDMPAQSAVGQTLPDSKEPCGHSEESSSPVHPFANPPEENQTVNPPTIQPSEDEVFDKASSLLKTINSIQNPEEPKEEIIDFEQVLEEKIENIAEVPIVENEPNKDKSFLDFVEAKNTTDKFHYLIIAAYYLSEVERLDRFSLKQLNAKLMQNVSTLIDHTVLQDALKQQFIDIVPDLTGVSEVCEYRLTEKGEEFYNSF